MISASPSRTVLPVLPATLWRFGARASGFLVVAFLSTLITFAITFISPADPAAELAGETATPQQLAAIHHHLGLDRPFLVQYASWLWNALHGNLGTSFFTNIPVEQSIAQRLPVDLSLAGLAVLLAVVFGLAAGIVAAARRGGIVDRAITALCAVALAVPEFWLGILLVIVFAVRIRLLPASGYAATSAGVGQWFRHLILPALCLAVPVSALIARQLRTSLVGVLAENYVTGAVVRGLGRRRILFKHALRNAAAPAVATIGLIIPQLIGGTVIAETVFALPGLGRLAMDSTMAHDLPVIQGILLVTIALVLVSNITTDVVLARLRPGAKA
jgi:peptide/nickel transport system permease protein